MKVLVVCSGNKGYISPYVQEQVASLSKYEIEIAFFQITGNRVLGYISNYFRLRQKIKNFKPNVVHAHYGLSGLLSTLQRIRPVIITFHGSDINNKRINKFSYLADKLAKHSIFVSPSLPSMINSKKHSIIPCSVDIDTFHIVDRKYAREELGLKNSFKYILFSSAFDNSIKNYALAAKAISILKNKNIKLLELKNYNRNQVNLLLNAVDCALLTSLSEGSPQFIKEAMACNCPIVSTDVGDVRFNLTGIDGCYITSYEPDNVAKNIDLALKYDKRTNARQRIFELGLDPDTIAKKIFEVYKQVADENN